jgi:hypothetical protein
MNDPYETFLKENPFLSISWNCTKCKKELQISQYIISDTGELNDICNTCSENSFEEHKYCKQCKQYLPLNQFYKRLNGLQNACKACYRQLCKYRYENKKYKELTQVNNIEILSKTKLRHGCI